MRDDGGEGMRRCKTKKSLAVILAKSVGKVHANGWEARKRGKTCRIVTPFSRGAAVDAAVVVPLHF
jgi:hypothetical protein